MPQGGGACRCGKKAVTDLAGNTNQCSANVTSR
jgi:hypothetical protein